jgi:thymidylate kinase
VDTVALVDSHAGQGVLVFGSLPPSGRDLDLLVRPSQEAELASALAENGFKERGRRWARFRDCTADVVELIPASEWKLPEGEEDALFADALPLEGAEHVTLPAPHHVLLIMARKLHTEGAPLDGRRRARVEDALAIDDGAFAEAHRRADLWGAGRALAALEESWRRGGRPRRRDLRAITRRPRRGALVTFSGLDGSGKSSQARALCDILDRLGFDTVVEWSSLSQHPVILHALTSFAGWALRRRGRVEQATSAGSERDAATKALRTRSRFVSFAWSVLVALANAYEQSRAVNRHLWRGRVVICDRYTLDSKVHLRYAYGDSRSYGVEVALIRRLSPRPDASYFLDISAETATGRKPDYGLVDNARRAALYREESGTFGTKRLDGERPAAEVCAAVAEQVWALLSSES